MFRYIYEKIDFYFLKFSFVIFVFIFILYFFYLGRLNINMYIVLNLLCFLLESLLDVVYILRFFGFYNY